LRQRTNAAAQPQAHFLGRGCDAAVSRVRLSQFSDSVADRSSCRPGVVPKPPGFGYGAVSYRGDLNGNATEIAGTWTIAGSFSGAFLMIRAGRSVPARARKKRATV